MPSSRASTAVWCGPSPTISVSSPRSRRFAQRRRVGAGAGADAPAARHAVAVERRRDELSAVLLRPARAASLGEHSRRNVARVPLRPTSIDWYVAKPPDGSRPRRAREERVVAELADGRRAEDAPIHRDVVRDEHPESLVAMAR